MPTLAGKSMLAKDVQIKKFALLLPKALIQSAGTLSEFHDIQLEYRDSVEENRMVKLPLEAEKERIEREIRKQERKLFIVESAISMRALQPQVKAIQQRYWGSSLECRFFSEWNSATIVSIGPPKEEKKDGKKDMSVKMHGLECSSTHCQVEKVVRCSP
uniref:Uncharacterized protein n=1 Tax=Cannabis sativa TaxID=3483 RepID=A0A803PGB6_CANSA